ncbi:Leucine-rich repeat protein [Giardia duodenalis]|uniref:Leucine-rich repeat protein n=1 Tax=Giardia intestinalis (strain ATCC 50803 / WB clone C6) TaxID=184922 RepID=D3KGT1_GIAIC|nr:Leucine-rich repeat protein [Giardia intestinalis]KAE8302081.1 Leucine-rich repeat protein [Giardia intestinalis]
MEHPADSMAGPMIRMLQLPSGQRTALVRNQCLTTPSSIILPSICDTLDLSHNNISAWPKWPSTDMQPILFQSITNLILSYNSLQRFDAPLKNTVPLLTGLSLRGTSIEELSELKYGIKGLKSLRCLDICETPLWERCTDADKQYNMVAELSNSCRALQVVSGVRVTLAHRKHIRTSKSSTTN